MDADIRKGDTLTDPRHKDDKNNLMLFDRVIANPPFSQDKWWEVVETNLEKKLDKDGKEFDITPNYNKVVVDKFGRFQYGIPPRSYGDLAFLQHMVAVLKEDGRMGIVLPHGTLFRGGTEGAIRQKLLENDIIEGIVGLPSALFYNTGIPASVWIINKSKPDRLKNKVIIIDASSEFKEGKAQNQLEENNIARVIDAYDREVDIDKFMRVVGMTEIKENDYNLNISRYIDTNEAEEEIDLKSVLESIAGLDEKEKAIDEKLKQYLKELGLLPQHE
jgi:type I restriction enzyme M protein